MYLHFLFSLAVQKEVILFRLYEVCSKSIEPYLFFENHGIKLGSFYSQIIMIVCNDFYPF